MPRARNIKPGFFRNADLIELSVEARLLFIGLWTIADRAGRLEDRPKQIKMEIYPADSFDVDVLLNELAATDMLLRYSVGGKRYIQVVNFCRHQNPHKDERPSTIPPPDGTPPDDVTPPAAEHHASTVQAPCSHSANTVHAPCSNDASTMQTRLIPDSLLLIPDSTSTPCAPAEQHDAGKRAELAAVAADRFDATRFLVEQGADHQTAADYLELRKAKKAASTRTALRAVVAEAAKAGIPVGVALTTCCARGWAGFKADWVEPKPRDGPAKAAKFDPVAHVNRNRIRQSETANIIDITAERLA